MTRTTSYTLLLLATTFLMGGRVTATGAGYSHTYQGVTYRYHDGYWWHGNRAYSRTYYQTPGYYSYGYYYPPVDHYSYTYSHDYVPPAPVTPSAPTYKPGAALQGLIDLAKQRDAVEGALRQQQLEYQQFQQAAKLLGLEGPRTWQGYGAFPAPAPYIPGVGVYGLPGYAATLNQLSYSAAGYQGDTLYGYHAGKTFGEFNPYADLSIASLFAQQGRITEAQQQLNREAVAGFNSTLNNVNAGAEKVAVIHARAQAARQILRDLEQPTFNAQKNQYQLTPTQPQPTQQPLPQQQPNQTAPRQMPSADATPTGLVGQQLVRAFFTARCGSCHLGEHKRGKFSLEGWEGWSAEKKTATLNWLVQPDRPETCQAGTLTELQLDLLRKN